MCRRILMRQYASSPRKDKKWIREIRGERLQGIVEGTSSAFRLASSPAAPFSGRNKCLGTHCSCTGGKRRQFLPDPSEFVVKERRRRGQGGESQRVEEKRNGRLVGAAEISGQLSEWRKLQRKNLNILGLPKRKEWPQCHKVSSWQGRHSRLCQNEKE